MPSSKPPELTLLDARRMAVEAQLLGARPRVLAAMTPEAVVSVIRRLGYVQRDPLSVVAQSHELVLWSRFGCLDRTAVERSLWIDRQLFEYWAHAAAMVPSSDLPLHQWRMRHYRLRPPANGSDMRAWVADHQNLRRRVLRQLAVAGPLPASAFAGSSAPRRDSSGWAGLADHQRMLEVLWFQGLVAVAGRDGRGRLWDLMERFLPLPAAAPTVSRRRALLELARRSLEAQGIATPRQIATHLSGGAPPEIEAAAGQLVRAGLASEVTVRGGGRLLPGTWLVPQSSLVSWESGRLRSWRGRAALLSPFDNLLIDRHRTELLFGFRYRMEIYVPRARRRYGYYVLPILYQDRLVGRLDCRRDPDRGCLEVISVHQEQEAGHETSAAGAIRGELQSLAAALGMETVTYADPRRLPLSWRAGLLD